MTQIFVINTGNEKDAQATIASLQATAPDAPFDTPQLIAERETREHTLNCILDRRNKNRDLLVIADDIQFQSGWFESLMEHKSQGDVIGFSMVTPNGRTILDYGYDFIQIDGRLSTNGLHKHEPVAERKYCGYRSCDAICGCAMFIKKGVLNKGIRFDEAGQNRWGEFIFCHEAKSAGFRVIVLASQLKHGAVSTKKKKDPQKSSPSWLIERQMWLRLVQTHFSRATAKQDLTRKIGPELKRLLNEQPKILIYGCGTVADFVLEKTSPKKFDICSGLPEEQGATLQKKTIKSVQDCREENYEIVLITPIGYNDKILPQFEHWDMPIKTLTESKNENSIIYELE